MNEREASSWHAIAVDDALARLVSSAEGLSGEEAERRLAEQGPNRLTPPRRESALLRFLAQFTNLLVLVLLVSAVVMLLIGELLDAAVVGSLVIVNAAIGFIQEGRAQRALEAVRNAVAPEALVLRGGRQKTVPATTLVTGDVVVLAAGTIVPADLRLIEERGLEIQEAALTGESAPVGKSLMPCPETCPLAERSDMAWSGTTVARGAGLGLVIATGDNTEIGQIGTMLARRERINTPLSRQLNRFSARLTVAILIIAAAVFAIGSWLNQMHMVEAFRAAVGVAIAAVPEALPAILTISMAVGVTRMAGRRAIIRKLPAVEALGSVDIICADKTGTITENRLTARTALTTNGRFEIPGAENGANAADPLVQKLARGALLANDAQIRREDGEWAIEGDLTDGALLIFARKLGVERDGAQRIASIPYEADQQYMAVLEDDPQGTAIWLKGAPERVLALCSSQAEEGGDRPVDHDLWARRVDRLAADGERVLAIACRRADGATRLDPAAIHAGDFTLLGLVGMIDPPRAGVKEAIASARQAGIAVKMITGDHPATAGAIAASVGLEGDTVTGTELDQLTDAEFAGRADSATIFARATPQHKQRLIGALQSQDKSIAMTGDGFNDAPALQKADIGVAMGGRGTEAAREASDIVLTDDNFTSIVAAVHEGRTVYENIRKALVYILPTSLGEAGLIILAVMLDQPLPITALQILWINLVTEATLSLAIAFDPAEPAMMQHPPRPRHESLLTRFLIWRIAFVATLMTLATWYLFDRFSEEASLELARTIVVNGLVACEIGYLINCRHLHRPAIGLDVLLANRIVPMSIAAVIGLQMMFTYAPFMQALFGSVPLGWADWGFIASLGLLVYAVVELEKLITRRGRA
ncbi:calcium-translocating P-type ATPase [Altererythrobacter atlanticus]|uniref:Cation-transporting ATPase F n=1 Tax=Croceibacterium atlanticum TaxID=1267766 RepID=A0A0F7KVN5_9SPHN|nr:HAD-IC family P-type ATPase [Croceibacterium atlanticum]AKH43779.1 putative cation-transporting ATPase F [Croceibacterium atlanticum]MBB5733772.1 calcium-translocating P-type ATPase [Croceibacterium atlanticum]